MSSAPSSLLFTSSVVWWWGKKEREQDTDREMGVKERDRKGEIKKNINKERENE